ncbi:MAG: PIN domain-containing protein [Planctomycetota bacterium]
MLNLDTHIVLHALRGELFARERRLLGREPRSSSAIVLWEITKLAQLGRVTIDLDDPDVADALGRLPVWPIDLTVCRALRWLDFASEPADELIAATSLARGVPLVTRDRRIRRSKLVPLA